MKGKHVIASIAAVLMGLFVSSCDKVIYDGPGNCPISVRFRFDFNLKYADAFRNEVKSVAVYVFDSQTGKFVTKATESGVPLTQEGYTLEIPGLETGKYDVIAWCGLEDGDSFSVEDPATKTDLMCRMKTATRTKATETYSNQHHGGLFYGIVEGADLLNLPPGSVNTVVIPLVKNTNNVRVLLQSINSDINLTPDQFDFAIYDINSELDWKDEIPENPIDITYDPFNTKQGSIILNDNTEVLTAAVAEFSIGRLFARTTNKTRLVITQRSNGNVVFDIPLVDYFLMVKGYYASPAGEKTQIDDQEYLDRQDDYSVVIFLEHKEGPEGYYIAARIYINGWQIVLINTDL